MWMIQNHGSQNNQSSKDLPEECMLPWLFHLTEQLLLVGLQQEQQHEEDVAGLVSWAGFILPT